MAMFFRIVAILVLLAGGYKTYADLASFQSGEIGAVSYIGSLLFAVALAGVLWAWGGRTKADGKIQGEQ